MCGLKHILTIFCVGFHAVYNSFADPLKEICTRHKAGTTYVKSNSQDSSVKSYYTEYRDGILLNSVSEEYVVNLRLQCKIVGSYLSLPTNIYVYDGRSNSSAVLKVISERGFYNINSTGENMLLQYQVVAYNTRFEFSCGSIPKPLPAPKESNTGLILSILLPVAILVVIVGGCVLYCRHTKKQNTNNCFRPQQTGSITRQGSVIRLHEGGIPALTSTVMSSSSACVDNRQRSDGSASWSGTVDNRQWSVGPAPWRGYVDNRQMARVSAPEAIPDNRKPENEDRNPPNSNPPAPSVPTELFLYYRDPPPPYPGLNQ